MAKRAKTTKKRPPRKVVRSKKARKKPVPSAKKRTRRPNPRQAEPEPDHKADVMTVQIDTWAAYERLRSVKATARETGYSEHVTREVLDSDTQRQHVILDDFLEACVAEWETKQVRAHGIMNQLFGLFEALMAEIGAAQAEGRATKIVDRNGVGLPVLSAVELMVVSKLFDQAAKCAQVAHSISESYRRGRGIGAGEDGEIGAGDNVAKWSDRALYDAIKAGGLKLPKVLEQKMKLLEQAV